MARAITSERDLFWGMTPFGRGSAALVAALDRAGAFAVVDLGESPGPAGATLAAAEAGAGAGGFGIRVAGAHVLGGHPVPGSVTTVVVAAGHPWPAGGFAGRSDLRVVAEVTSLEEAQAALAAGAGGLVAKGAESGGRVGDMGSFVLLQQLVRHVDLPLWCQGGMGLHTAAAAIAGGATGVVFDTQLALVSEVGLPDAVRSAIASMDGAETAVVGGHRILVRPGVATADPSDGPAEVASRLGVDLGCSLLAAGQDTSFAAGLAQRFHTAGGVVRAVRRAMSSQLGSARSRSVLAPGSAFATNLGLRYPIAQGPMTRVSDSPDFAAAVAAAGGLPFVALALMAPDDAAALLDRTRALLGERTWGVGILGFVPPELRAGQLAAVVEARPRVALIAGGRPALARPLEEAGIATFLHVPSPGLLELFVREGARRFVFEGRECGGHVGPRSSFVLWEQQIAQLLKSGPEGMDLLFAGGIHDSLSASMVAAMTVPLVEAGARVGVLMGTAYLFTDEAVATGAIQAPFQEVALACGRTALLETAPGHTTRCAQTPFVARFDDRRQALEAAGTSGPDRWAALEELNLGRLRVAAKGIRRQGPSLVRVEPAEQREEGLYMIGEAAVLRSEATTVAALHHDVSVGSGEVLDALEAAHAAPAAEVGAADVAVIGLACVFPGAGSATEYWSNIVDGTSHMSEVSRQRWDPALYCDSEVLGPKGTVTPSRWGGFLDPVPFDPVRFGIPPSSLGAIEPVQLLSLEVAARALADAGYAERDFDRSRTSVVFGVEGASDLSSAYVFRSLAQTYLGSVPDALDQHLPAMTEDSFPGVLSNVVAGRIANRLDLGGTNLSVDAACAASLAAVHLACQELATASADMVLCGGADLHNGIYDYQLFASVGALSATGACRSFDQSADGIALGEGVACVVLKRLADAAADGDRIYAVIKGVGSSSDGRSLGLTAPRGAGQRLALERAYGRAGVGPETVGLVEAHGTGTVVGDRTELSALTAFFGDAGSLPGSCALGSVKSQIGHTKCAAGMAGLIKASLALHHAVLPPAAQLDRPSLVFDRATSPFAFAKTARPWAGSRRRAGVSAFGFGGSNFHVVMESCGTSPPAHGLEAWPAELFLLRGDDGVAVEDSLDDIGARLGRPGVALRDLAAHVWARGSGPVRAAVVATSIEDLRAKLAMASGGQAGPGVYLPARGPGGADSDGADSGRGDSGRGDSGGIAFLFPGQGSQRPGMLADVFVAFPRLHRLLRLAEAHLPVMFPPASADPDVTAAQRAAHNDTRVAQPTLGVAGLAMATLLADLGVRPDALGGHSFGELVALSVAGVFSAGDLILLSEARGAAMAASSPGDPGAMAAVAGPAARLTGLLGRWPGVVVANDNSPRQAVISGPSAGVAEAAAHLSGEGVATRLLPVACGFHSHLMAAAAGSVAAA
ncbi:MAG: beta-ketoacyl synthase N-terminal-like domain-containing protein, partial [Acidimicrobiales bacterium]